MLPRFTFFVFLIFLLVACASPSSNPISPGSNDNQPPLPSPATNEIFSPRDSHQALNYDDKLWVIGGTTIKDATSVLLNDVWFSDDGRAWQQATADASWQPRSNFGATVFDGKMWLLGGSIFAEDNTIINFNDVWNSTNGKDWHLVTSDAAWLLRSGDVDPFILNGKMWVLNSYNNEVWTSTNGKSWQIEGNTSTSFFSYESMVFENKVWILEEGYRNASGDGIDGELWYSSDGINYTQSHLHNFANLTSLAFQNRIWLLGGFTIPEYDYNRKFISFNPDNTSDTQTFTPNWHQRYGQASVVFDNKIWLLGGAYYSGDILDEDNFSLELFTFFNDIWSWDNSQSDWTKER